MSWREVTNLWNFAARGVYHLRFNRPINRASTHAVLERLRNLRGTKRFDAFAISIETAQGDHNYAKILVDSIEEFSRTNLVPVYTFTEDAALDSGYLFALAGKTITANPFSVIGDIGRSRKVKVIQGLLDKFAIKFKQYPSGILR